MPSIESDRGKIGSFDLRRFRRVGTRTRPSGVPFPSCYYVKKRRRGRKGKSGKYVKPINASSVRRSYLPSRAVSRESRLIWRKNRRQRLSQRKRDEGIRKEQFLSPDFPWMKSRRRSFQDILFFIYGGGERNLTKDFESIDDWSRTTSTDRETTEFQRRGWRKWNENRFAASWFRYYRIIAIALLSSI